MAGTDLSRLLRWYPPAWRERYGDDLCSYLQDIFGDGRPPIRARLSLAIGGLRERSRLSGISGDSVPPGDRVRAGALIILCSWTAFMIAGANFAKLSEHFDQALPARSAAHHLPDTAYTTIQTGAAVAGTAVIVGGLLALPVFVRFLRSGGWSTIKRWAISAIASSVMAVVIFLPLRNWAHHLSDSQRNGGSAGYEALFLIGATVVAASLILWTAVAVAGVRRVSLSRRVLTIEAGLAVVVAAAMVVILAATALWWVTLAQRAPFFLSSDQSTPVNARLTATMIIMVVSAASATGGVARLARTWRPWRRT